MHTTQVETDGRQSDFLYRRYCRTPTDVGLKRDIMEELVWIFGENGTLGALGVIWTEHWHGIIITIWMDLERQQQHVVI
jgi:hypothetical protein